MRGLGASLVHPRYLQEAWSRVIEVQRDWMRAERWLGWDEDWILCGCGKDFEFASELRRAAFGWLEPRNEIRYILKGSL